MGNLVTLNTGEVAVVTEVHAPDPHRPQVRIIRSTTNEPVTGSAFINLWEEVEEGAPRPEIVGLADQREIGIDPLTLL